MPRLYPVEKIMNAKQHLQSALDALTYQAEVNRVFAAAEFSTIKAHLDAVGAFLESQDESYFDDGATFEEFVANEFLEEEPAALPTVATLINVGLGASICLEFSDKTGVWHKYFSATEKALETAKELQARGIEGVQVVYAEDGTIADLLELPF